MGFDFGYALETLKGISVLLAVLMTSYAGFVLITSRSAMQREEWKETIAGVFIGLILLYLAPFIASQLTFGI